MDALENKVYDINYEIKSEQSDNGAEALYISGIANTKGVADAYGDVPTGKRVYDLQRYKKNPLVLVDHVNSVGNIIGRMVKVEETDEGLIFKMRVMENPQTDIARHAVEAIKTGYAAALSIGGKWTYGKDLEPAKDGTPQRELTKALIYEISLVGIGADANAQTSVAKPKAMPEKESIKNADLTPLRDLVKQMRGLKEIDNIIYGGNDF